MKITGYAPAVEYRGRHALAIPEEDQAVFQKVLKTAKGRALKYSVETVGKNRTDAQLRIYWKVLTLLFIALNGEKPTEAERLALHEEIKELHGNKRRALLDPEKLVSIGFSDGDTADASALIDGVFLELWDQDLKQLDQVTARELLRGFWALGGQKFTSEADFRARAKYCAACGSGERIELAHVESRGANPGRIDDPVNFIPLCNRCHGEQHLIGVKAFLRKFPHLEARWNGSHSKGAVNG